MKIKKCFFIIIGGVLGIFLMGTISYVVAESLIDSKDVIYKDNSSLAANNVQDAIDGTCSKIDTRLSAIEDKLWNVNSFSKAQNATVTNTLSYSNIYVDIPAKSFCSLYFTVFYNRNRPLTLTLASSSTELHQGTILGEAVNTADSMLVLPYATGYDENSRKIYIWLRGSEVEGVDAVSYYGFCATKVK